MGGGYCFFSSLKEGSKENINNAGEGFAFVKDLAPFLIQIIFTQSVTIPLRSTTVTSSHESIKSSVTIQSAQDSTRRVGDRKHG